jgi:hypothetical protein
MNIPFGDKLCQVAFNKLNAKTATVFENASKARIFKNLRRGGSPPRYTKLQSSDCNLVQQYAINFAEGGNGYLDAKLRSVDDLIKKHSAIIVHCKL